jgi:hypothetical protein
MTLTAHRPEAPAETPPRRRWHVGLVLLGLLCFGMLAYRLPHYVPPDPATSGVDPRNGPHYALLVAHVFTASVAIGVGSLQFWPGIRRRFPRVHRWLGRAYFFLGVFPSAVLAVPVALLSRFGLAQRAGLLLLAGLWFGTAVAGYRATRQHRYADHRRWMIRNFAITTSSAVARIWQPILLIIAIPQVRSMYHGDGAAMISDVVGTASWLSWVGNVLIAEAWIRRPLRPARRPTRPEPRSRALPPRGATAATPAP